MNIFKHKVLFYPKLIFWSENDFTSKYGTLKWIYKSIHNYGRCLHLSESASKSCLDLYYKMELFTGDNLFKTPVDTDLHQANLNV